MTPRRARLRRLATFTDMAKAFGSVDAMLDKLSQGWIHDIQGEPVFRNPPDGRWYNIPAAMEGWIALWERLDTHYTLGLDLTPLRQLNNRLAYGTPITPRQVAASVQIVTACKRAYRKMDMIEVGSIARTQMIANALEEQLDRRKAQ